MAQNFIASGEVLEVVAPAGGLTTGQAILIGAIVCVALNTAAAGKTGQVATSGAFRSLSKKVGEAWAQGAKVYWDNVAKNFTTTVGANTFAGYAYDAAAAGDAVGNVVLANGI